MKVLVTGVSGQLGHDVMNELAKRGYTGVGSDIAPEYSGVDDNTAVVNMEYVQMDITDEKAVDEIITRVNPDVIVHCAAWTAVDMAEMMTRLRRCVQSMPEVQEILQRPLRSLTARWYI